MLKPSKILFTAASAMLITFSASAHAEDHEIGHVSPDSLKNSCAEAGGTYVESGDQSFYGCKTDCPGGSCAVICDTEECFGTTPNRRNINRNPTAHIDTLKGVSFIDASNGEPGKGSDRTPWGLAGLFGLIGLAGVGLRKRD